MHTFPDITVEPVFWLDVWWPIFIPIGAAIFFFAMEYVISGVVKRVKKKEVAGWGFGPMAFSLGVGLIMALGILPADYTERTDDRMIEALEGIGMEEIRMTFSTGTFGAYYDGELIRGIVIPSAVDDTLYKVVETPPPS